ncbi:MAG TPA: putative F420-0 ABC transporter substrate-binding protein [Beutenbergiaceae bacterium]|nr:putative F420-0 ABC transporter substrate-binding protein [Beutenbergiaceae bacterium]
MPRGLSRSLACPILAAATLFLAGCTAGAAPGDLGEPESSSTGSAESPATESSASVAPRSDYPITVDNCGTEVQVDEPPQRIVTIKSTSTEMVLALGLGDRLVGTAFSDGPMPQWLQQDVPVLAEEVPSSEAVLAKKPDFIFAGWESNFSADGAGTRGELADLGIDTYVSPAACLQPPYQPDPLTFDHVFDYIQQVGNLLGVPQRAADLIEEQRATLAEVDSSDTEMTALWYSSGSDTPFVGGGIGAPQMLMDAVGLTNIMTDVHESWASASWEAIAAQDPDVLVLVDSSWNSVEHKIEVLESNPVTATMTAVQQQRYLVLPFPASEAGVRSVPAAVDLSEQLNQLAGDDDGQSGQQ